jgi:D-3-phosphoglycerate dehydrogenase
MSSIRVAWSPSSFCTVNDAPLRLLERVGIEVVANPYGRRLTADEAIAHLQNIDGLIAGLEPLTRDVLGKAPRLRAVARVGIGIDNVDLVAARELGIAVSNTPEAPSAAVAELTIAAALALTRGLVSANAAMHGGRWEKATTTGLRGLVCLVVGYGRIGKAVGRAMQALGAQVLVADPEFRAEDGVEVEHVSLEDGLARAQLISLHAAGRNQILGTAEFASMRPGVLLLNSARGELVSEKAVVVALEGGKLGGAWFDVFWDEPYQGPLTGFPQVLLTPHLGTYTEACRTEMEMQAVQNLLRDLRIDAT